MSLSFKFVLGSAAKQVRLIDSLRDNTEPWIVWMYTKVQKNHNAKSQPNVSVAFRKVLGPDLLGEIFLKEMPLTSLGQLRIGTVWNEGICRSEMLFDEEEFLVDFTEDKWNHTSFSQSAEFHESPPYSFERYPLQYQRDKNWFLEFNTIEPEIGQKLVIPCLEFFYRCFGRSAEVKRVLATYPWDGRDDSVLSRFYAPLDEPEEQEKWKVRLKMRLVRDDAVLLAHAKYEQYTRNALKEIYSQIARDFDNRSPAAIFLQIRPWHQGLARIRVRGFRLNDGSFLGMQIIGCTEPGGVLIQRELENQRESGDTRESQDEDGGSGISARCRILDPHQIVDLTGTKEPDHSTGGVEILDTDFVHLGERRAIVDVRRDRGKSRGGRSSLGGGSDDEEFSSGESYGSGKGVGNAEIHAKLVMESHGMLRDMWNAMLYLKRQHPKLIRKVEWFTFESRFSSDPIPELIGLKPFKNDDQTITTKVRNWVYLNIDEKSLRGILVARLITNEKDVFILEIQRRKRVSQSENGLGIQMEESFQGLVFTLNDAEALPAYLSDVLQDIRKKTGVFQKLTGTCPGNATTFNHKHAEDDLVNGHAIVINALRKMDIYVGLSDSSIG